MKVIQRTAMKVTRDHNEGCTRATIRVKQRAIIRVVQKATMRTTIGSQRRPQCDPHR